MRLAGQEGGTWSEPTPLALGSPGDRPPGERSPVARQFLSCHAAPGVSSSLTNTDLRLALSH